VLESSPLGLHFYIICLELDGRLEVIISDLCEVFMSAIYFHMLIF
jgi:hypothetical protein